MKLFKALTFLFITVVILIGFTQCSSSKKGMNTEESKGVEEINQSVDENTTETSQVPQVRGKEMPLFIRDTYFQRWVAGQEDNGSESGTYIYFPTLINKSNFKMDKVYFRGMIADFQIGKASYFANLKPRKVDVVMSIDPNAEYGNTMPTKAEPFPFELKPNECMISYIDNGEIKYFQVYNIVEKTEINDPTAPPKQNKD